MPTQADTAVLPLFRFLLTSGSTPLLASGLLFTIWAVWNVFKPPQERWILAQVVAVVVSGCFRFDRDLRRRRRIHGIGDVGNSTKTVRHRFCRRAGDVLRFLWSIIDNSSNIPWGRRFLQESASSH